MGQDTHADVLKTGCDGMESILATELFNGVAWRPIGYYPFTSFRLTAVAYGNHIKISHYCFILCLLSCVFDVGRQYVEIESLMILSSLN